MVLLRAFASNVTSQNGEDGMLSRLIADLRIGSGLCVEFGAWDGKHLSNTWTLWAEKGWRAILIEADPYRYDVLRRATADRANVTAVCALVGTEPSSSLEAVVPGIKDDPDFALLSVDIDGDDYWVWKAVQSQPPIVVVEYNCSFPPEVDFVPEIGTGSGASAAAFVRLAAEKGYTLVDLNQANLIFVSTNRVAELTVETHALEELFDRSLLPLVYSDMRGIHHLVKPGPWGFSGVRADIGATRFTGRFRFLSVRTAKWIARKDVPLLSPWLRAQIHRLSTAEAPSGFLKT